ncbi:MAG: hypothetical protein GF308_11945 [Candidatus Heimdallarchaeota archaeon]|nr:hypothetical protein [Candidatus Heimdallarchaeota archaeon]
MCHLAGYIGNQKAVSVILDSLKIQEPIIGAQATGLAVLKKGKIIFEKDIGPLQSFEKKHSLSSINSKIAIGHTRFAIKSINKAETNTKAKAHPFISTDKSFVTMHNGTIFNDQVFIEQLEAKGYTFRSKTQFFDKEKDELVTDYTDSELFTYRLEEKIEQTSNIKQAIKKACEELEGHFAFVVLHVDHPNKLFIANWMQPLYIAYSEYCSYFCSFKIGYEIITHDMPWKIKPPFNSLITITPGKISLEPLLPNRKKPEYTPDKVVLEFLIKEAIKEGNHSIAEIWLYFNEHCQELGFGKEEWSELSKINGFTFSPIIYDELKRLVHEDKLVQKLEYVYEGGQEDIPRYNFYLRG